MSLVKDSSMATVQCIISLCSKPSQVRKLPRKMLEKFKDKRHLSASFGVNCLIKMTCPGGIS